MFNTIFNICIARRLTNRYLFIFQEPPKWGQKKIEKAICKVENGVIHESRTEVDQRFLELTDNCVARKKRVKLSMRN